MDICACITLEQYPARSLVFEQDDTRCDKAYIVLEGTVQVYQRQSSDVFEKAEDEQKITPVVQNASKEDLRSEEASHNNPRLHPDNVQAP